VTPTARAATQWVQCGQHNPRRLASYASRVKPACRAKSRALSHISVERGDVGAPSQAISLLRHRFVDLNKGRSKGGRVLEPEIFAEKRTFLPGKNNSKPFVSVQLALAHGVLCHGCGGKASRGSLKGD